MGIETWIPLVLIAFVFVILILYLLRQKVDEFEVSSTLLWRELYRNIEATKPWEKLRKNLLMILQIAAFFFLMAALMHPYWSKAGDPQERLILVIDCSASMNTKYDSSATRLDAAKEKACALVDRVGLSGTVTVISSSNQGTLLLANSRDSREIKETIRSILPTSLPGSAADSLNLVQSAATQREESQIVFFTDTDLDPGMENASIVSLYRDCVNVSMDAMSCSASEEGISILVRMTNHSDQTLEREINLYGEEKLLDIQQTILPAGETVVLYFEEIPAEGNFFRAEFQEEDDLAGDNQTFCVRETSDVRRILLVTDSNLFLEKAFLLLPGVEVYRTRDLTEDWSEESGFDLYVLDGVDRSDTDSGRLPMGNLLLINSRVGGITEERERRSNPILTFSEGELTGYIANEQFGVNEASSYALPLWGKPFLTGEDFIAGYFGEYDGRRIAVMGFDLHKTDFGLQASFPVLISHLADYLLMRGLASETAICAGDLLSLNGSTSGGDLNIVRPDGNMDTLAPSALTVSYPDTETPGVYQVSQTIGEEERTQYIAVNFPSESESHVAYARDLDSEASTSEAVMEHTVDLRPYALLLLLLVLTAEWYVYVKQT